MIVKIMYLFQREPQDLINHIRNKIIKYFNLLDFRKIKEEVRIYSL